MALQITGKRLTLGGLVTGGSKSVTKNASSLKKAATIGKTKVSSPQKYKFDHVRGSNDSSRVVVLGRIRNAHPTSAKSGLDRVIPKEPPKSKATTGNVPKTDSVQVPTVPNTPNVTPVTTNPMDKLAGEFGDCVNLFKGLASPPDLPTIATPKERDEAEAKHTSERVKVRVKADKVFKQVNATLTEKIKLHKEAVGRQDAPAAQALEQEISKLKSMRNELADLLIRAELKGGNPGEHADVRGLPAVNSLRAVQSFVSTVSSDDNIRSDVINDIGRGIDAFNAGKEQVILSDGRAMDIHEFHAAILKFADDLQPHGDYYGGDQIPKAVAELRKLAGALEPAIAHRDMLQSFAQILDKSPDFPVGGAILSFCTALPSVRDDAQSEDPARHQRASEGLKTLADMVLHGDLFPNMMGIDKSFDDAAAKFQTKRGGMEGVDHLRRAHGDKPFPQKDLIDKSYAEFKSLADDKKTLQTLTVAEQACVDKIAQLTGGTQDEAFKLAGDIGKALKKGEAIAENRRKLTDCNIGLAKLLTSTNKRWFKPWTWGDKDVQVFSSAPQSIAKDVTLVRALHKLGNGATGQEIALFVASLHMLERQTLKDEHEIFGLHQNYRPQDATKDVGAVLKEFGLSDKDLLSIGVKSIGQQKVIDGTGGVQTATENVAVSTKSLVAALNQLNAQGVGSVEDVAKFNTALNDVSKIVLKSELTQEMIHGYESENARALGQRLATELMSDAYISNRKLEKTLTDKDANLRPRSDNPDVAKHFQNNLAHIKFMLGDPTTSNPLSKTGNVGNPYPNVWNDLKQGKTDVARLEQTIAASYDVHLRIESTMEAYSKYLSEVSGEGDGKLGFNIDVNSPRGLQSAKKILEALKYHELSQNPKTAKMGEKHLKEVLEDLRGFDLETMRRPWHSKLGAVLNIGKKPDIVTLEKLRTAAEAIVYLREDGPRRREETADTVDKSCELLDKMLTERREKNPRAMQLVTDMVRTAVLTEWSTAKSDLDVVKGTVTEGFDPSRDPARKGILKTLDAWGLKANDLDHFLPEVNAVLYSRITSDDIVEWSKEAAWSSSAVSEYENDNPPRFSKEAVQLALKEVWRDISTVDGLLNRKVMDTDTRKSLLSLLEGFQEGDKLDLKSGQRVTLDSGKVPVEPSGLVGIRGRLAGSHLGQFEIERGSDGYKLHLRTGFGVKGNVDLMVGQKFLIDGGPLQLQAQLSAGVEGSGSKLDGVSISFDKDKKGLESLISLVSKMIDGEQIDLWDWKDAIDVGSGSEVRKKGAVNLSAVGQMQLGSKETPKLDDKNDTLGAGINAQGNIQFSVGTKGNKTESLKETTLKGEKQCAVVLGASLSVYARIYNPMNIGTGFAANKDGSQTSATETMGKNQYAGGSSNMSMTDNVQNIDLLGVGVQATYSYTDKWKHVIDKDGIFTKCETVRQANVRQGKIQAFAVCDRPEIQMILEKTDKPENVQFAKDFKLFMDLTGPDDFIAMTYGLKDDMMQQANELVRRANVARRDGRTTLADLLDKQARAIVNDDANYAPQKIGLVTTSEKSSEISNVNARWVSWSTFSDGKMEHTGAVLKFPT